VVDELERGYLEAATRLAARAIASARL